VNEYIKKSNVTFVERVNVTWGGYSLIQATFNVLKEANKHKYRYYHLISGSDMPLKSASEIYHFFDGSTKNYINYIYENVDSGSESYTYRYKFYHLFRKYINRNFQGILGVLERVSLHIQNRYLKINRIKDVDIRFYHGSQWFSITHELVQYILSSQKFIQDTFRYGFCVDEIFVQTLAKMSPYASKIENNYLRFIDWERGNPYYFRENDIDILLANDNLFARKFNPHVDKNIIDMLYKRLSHEIERQGDLLCFH
jgi:hypothetical protein